METTTASGRQDTALALDDDIASFRRSLRAGNLSPKTIATYTEAVTQFAAFLAAHGMPTAIEGIRREHVEAFIGDLLERYKPATAHNRYAGIQAFYRWALEEGLVKDSPMARMRPPKIPETPVAVLREAQLKALLGAADRDRTFVGRRDVAILRLFATTGARRSEVANLRWTPDDETTHDVDLEQEQIRVLGKGRRERLLVLDRKAVLALDRYLRLRRGHPYAHLPWLWLGQKGRLTDSGIAQMVKERGRQAGLGDRVHPHQLRHSYAHRMLANGMQETDLMRNAGWRSRAMLQKYGASAGDERARAAARKINALDEL